MKFTLILILLILFVTSCGTNDNKPNPVTPSPTPPDLLAMFPNSSGLSRTVSSTGSIDQDNPFFKSLGNNGRACVTCHQAAEGWTITPEGVQERFEATGGQDPIFRLVDGANSPFADTSTLETRRGAFSMLLQKGLIRVGMPIPEDAEFTLEFVDDPYGFASSKELSLFRRPLPTTNLRFLSTLMWDGRETVKDQTMHLNLVTQANSATVTHAEASRDLTAQEREQIVTFQMQLHSAQVFDNELGHLNQNGGQGGPQALANQEFYIGINDPIGLNPKGIPFDPSTFTLFSTWDGQSGAKGAVARGEKLFNTKPISLTGVAGLNDALGQASIQGTCTICHDSPNVGNHSVSMPLNIGLADASQRTPDMPLYTLKNKTTDETIQTTDPGRALVTGKWADIGKFKGPILRGLSARAPYFHNGSAATLEEAVNFYNTRFSIGLTDQEISDLVAFLKTL